ncbi:[citrate (pro-3S)-lyase] ligase [Desulfosporosinus meridiei]|uniref:[Citrate [pro-3S]-lyase] ligase n=1 Tax=Desulfosporosinus meridiei (strain ATCC BAA-275 / DSM 13257 / KCTC 12902 / NCIMB 13706 / S10) TaxID=768704 RepID=J7J469_DESMD|nr:[citrate (pro-3S)-lyase] ligase [Desulfosporosinus meridiei]AFQ46073.1 (citrate (pro-3S)-lyase) ligase [Desulfosporosinus meridiei DSM 13257]
MVYGAQVARVNLKDRAERKEVDSFLGEFGLILEGDVDYTCVVRDEEPSSQFSLTERAPIVATCSKAKNVLKCFAIAHDLRGEGMAATLVTALIDRLFSEGIHHYFVYTNPCQVKIFSALGFKLIHQNQRVALLENGFYDISQHLEELKTTYDIGTAERAALVMNCNPFTLGHQFLIEEAARNHREVLVFIVEEDKSLFPFAVRLALVTEGTKHLPNVKIIPSGEYIISSATFPAYFLREEGERLQAYAELDASIFGKYFCSSFQILKRYVGEELYCPVTKAYNETLKKVLPIYGVELEEVKRIPFAGEPISASRVRSLLREGEAANLINLLPEVTLKFLDTSPGREIVEKIRQTHSPH